MLISSQCVLSIQICGPIVYFKFRMDQHKFTVQGNKMSLHI